MSNHDHYKNIYESINQIISVLPNPKRRPTQNELSQIQECLTNIYDVAQLINDNDVPKHIKRLKELATIESDVFTEDNVEQEYRDNINNAFDVFWDDLTWLTTDFRDAVRSKVGC